MEYEAIILKKEERIGTIILNRPEKLNAVNYQMIVELRSAIEDVANDEGMRVLIITGAGRAFCAGGDFRLEDVKEGKFVGIEAEDMGPEKGALWRGDLLSNIPKGITLALQRMGKPTIAMVNGYAIGLGFDIAISCDMRVGSYNARFVAGGEIRIGLVPHLGSTWLMPRIAGLAKTLELILTGDVCTAEEAYRIGLLNRLVPAESLEKETLALAAKVADGPPIAQRLTKLQIYKGLEMNLETAVEFGMSCLSIALQTKDHVEGIKAMAERRRPCFQGR